MPTVLHPKSQSLGEIVVKRVLPAPERAMVGPFVFLDHVGPDTFAPGQGIDVRPHPHIGLSTLTYLFEGAFMHRDSLGHARQIDPGAVNWMTAGSGIVHSERSPDELRAAGHRLHGLQIWVALPDGAEDVAPSFHHFEERELPRVIAPGIDLRLLAGRGFHREAPTPVHSPLCCAVLKLARQMRFELGPEYPERAAYVVSGRVASAGTEIPPQTLAVFEPGHTLYLDALEPAVLLLLGGEPIGTRRLWWNFVASDSHRIDAAKRRWREGGFPGVPGDPEFIPLPGEG
jgi:hypothetical protein